MISGSAAISRLTILRATSRCNFTSCAVKTVPMPPEAMTPRNSKLCSITGSITGCPHFLHGSVANGGRSPEMKVLVLQRPHVTIFKARLVEPVTPSLTDIKYHDLPGEQASLTTIRSAGALEEPLPETGPAAPNLDHGRPANGLEGHALQTSCPEETASERAVASARGPAHRFRPGS